MIISIVLSSVSRGYTLSLSKFLKSLFSFSIIICLLTIVSSKCRAAEVMLYLHSSSSAFTSYSSISALVRELRTSSEVRRIDTSASSASILPSSDLFSRLNMSASFYSRKMLSNVLCLNSNFRESYSRIGLPAFTMSRS
jgi:hypothetical protein